MVSSTPRPNFTPGKDPVPILQEAGWEPGPVWTGGKSRPHRDSIPERPDRSSVAIPTELPGQHTIHRRTKLISEECGPCPVFASYTLSFALQLRKNQGKNLSQVLLHYLHGAYTLSEFFIYQLMHKRVALKIILKFTLKQPRHASV